MLPFNRTANGQTTFANTTRQSSPDDSTALVGLVDMDVHKRQAVETCEHGISDFDATGEFQQASMAQVARGSIERDVADREAAVTVIRAKFADRLQALQRNLTTTSSLQYNSFPVWKALVDQLDSNVTSRLTEKQLELETNINVLKDELSHAKYNADDRCNALQRMCKDLESSMRIQAEEHMKEEEKLKKECTDWRVRYDDAQKDHRDERAAFVNQAEECQKDAKSESDKARHKAKKAVKTARDEARVLVENETAKRLAAEQNLLDIQERMTRTDRMAEESVKAAKLECQTLKQSRQEALDRAETAETHSHMAERARQEALDCATKADHQRQSSEKTKQEAIDYAKRADNQRKLAESARQDAMVRAETADSKINSIEKAREDAVARAEAADIRMQSIEQARHEAVDYANEAKSQTELAEKARDLAQHEQDMAVRARLMAESQRQFAHQSKLTADTQRVAAEEAKALAQDLQVSAENDKVSAEWVRDREILARIAAEEDAHSQRQARRLAETEVASLQLSKSDALHDNEMLQAANNELSSELIRLKRTIKRDIVKRRRTNTARKVYRNKAKHFGQQLESCQILLKDAKTEMSAEVERLESIICSREEDIKALSGDLSMMTVENHSILDQASLLEDKVQEQDYCLLQNEETITALRQKVNADKTRIEDVMIKSQETTKQIQSLKRILDGHVKDIFTLCSQEETKVTDLARRGIPMPLLKPQLNDLQRMLFIGEWESGWNWLGSSHDVLAFVIRLELGELNISKLITLWQWTEAHYSEIDEQIPVNDPLLHTNMKIFMKTINEKLRNVDNSKFEYPQIATMFHERLLSLNFLDDVSLHRFNTVYTCPEFDCTVGQMAHPMRLYIHFEAAKVLIIVIDRFGATFPYLSDSERIGLFMWKLCVYIMSTSSPLMVLRVNQRQTASCTQWCSDHGMSKKDIPEHVKRVIDEWSGMM